MTPAPGANDDLRSQAAKGVVWTAAGNWGAQIGAFLVFAILSRLLEPDAFGLVALAAVFVGLSQVLANQGLVDALVQRRDIDRAHLDTAFVMSMAFGIAITALIAVLAVPIATALGEQQLAPVLAGLSLAIAISGLSLVQRALLMRDFAFRSLALRNLAAVAVGSVVGIGAALLGFGVWSLVAQNLANQVVATLVVWWVVDWRPRLRFSRAHFSHLFGYGSNVVAFKVLNFCSRRADHLLIGAYLGPAALGFYSVAVRMLTLLIEVTSNLIDQVAFPLFARLQDQGERLERIYYKATSFAALVAFPAFTIVLVAAPQIVAVVFGSKWSQSVPVMRALALFGAFQALNYLNSTMLKALGKPSWRVIIVGVTAVVNLVAILLTVRHGIVAVALAMTGVGYLLMPASYWAVSRLMPIDPRMYLRHVRGPVLASLVMAAGMLGLQRLLPAADALLVLIVLCVAGVVLYAGAIALLARPLLVESVELGRRAITRRARGGAEVSRRPVRSTR